MNQEAVLEFIRERVAAVDGFTSTQIAERLETSPRTILPILTAMMKRGQISATMVVIEDAWGRRRRVPGYRTNDHEITDKVIRSRRRDSSSQK